VKRAFALLGVVVLCFATRHSAGPMWTWPGSPLSDSETRALERIVASGGTVTTYGWPDQLHVAFPEHCAGYRRLHQEALSFTCGYGARQFVGRRVPGMQMSDADLVALAEVRGVVGIDLCGTGVGDASLSSLARSASLRFLRLHGTAISREAIERFRAQKPTVNVTS
jgi:hypothetical protein